MHRTMNKKNSICTHLSHECVVYMPLLHYTTQVDTKTTPSHVHPQCTCWQEPRYVQHDGGIHCIYMFWDVLHVNHSRWEGMLLFLNNVITLMRSAWCQFVAFKSSLGLGLRSLLLNVRQSAFSTWTHIHVLIRTFQWKEDDLLLYWTPVTSVGKEGMHVTQT